MIVVRNANVRTVWLTTSRWGLSSMTYIMFSMTPSAQDREYYCRGTGLNLNRYSGTRAYAYVTLHALNHIRKQRHDPLQSLLALRSPAAGAAGTFEDVVCRVGQRLGARGRANHALARRWQRRKPVVDRDATGGARQAATTRGMAAAIIARACPHRATAQYVGSTSRLEPSNHSSDRPPHVPSALVAWRCLRCEREHRARQ